MPLKPDATIMQKLPENWQIADQVNCVRRLWSEGNLMGALLAIDALEGQLRRHWSKDKEYQHEMADLFKKYENDKKGAMFKGTISERDLNNARMAYLRKRFWRIQDLIAKEGLNPPDDTIYDEAEEETLEATED